MLKKLLVIEDDKELNSSLCSYLQQNEYNTVSCENGLEALIVVENQKFDLIISDIMMPKIDGFTFVEKIREKDKKTPIIFMTARDDKFSKQLGYKLGIDDYIVKPFDIEELALKIGAILRRTTFEENKELVVGNLTLNCTEHMGYIDGKEMSLTVREFDLLFKLLSYPKKTFTRSQLMEEFWDFDSSATSRTVDVYMAKLREKTSNCNGFEIVTVHGLGYKVVLK
ncbi:MAG: response regulator transcription factor [Clostridia bacterium]|nr:response regulator transcription factor [Clostridia bacterium]